MAILSNGWDSHHKHLHGQQINASIYFGLQLINQTSMILNGAQCFESFNWKIHTLLYMTHWTIKSLLTKLKATECYHIPSTILASTWISTSLESTNFLPISLASTRIIDGFGSISSSLKATMSFVSYIWQQLVFNPWSFTIFDNNFRHSCSYIWGTVDQSNRYDIK